MLRDAMQVSVRLRRSQQGNFTIDSSRSAMYMPATKNFPLNTELESTITFVNADGTIGNYVQSVAPSSNALTMRMHHSFVQLPDAGYTPRIFDPRSSIISAGTGWRKRIHLLNAARLLSRLYITWITALLNPSVLPCWKALPGGTRLLKQPDLSMHSR